MQHIWTLSPLSGILEPWKQFPQWIPLHPRIPALCGGEEGQQQIGVIWSPTQTIFQPRQNRFFNKIVNISQNSQVASRNMKTDQNEYAAMTQKSSPSPRINFWGAVIVCS